MTASLGLVGVVVILVEVGAPLTLFVLLVRAIRHRRGLRGTVGPGAAGAVYELLNEDKRAAIEVIAEERTGYRDPEDRDGNMDDLDSADPPPTR